uniref:hypothetical protein n=1 Tax=Candidatus Fimivicinus sp. TaxID=3056640 RepID=UPI003FEE97C3
MKNRNSRIVTYGSRAAAKRQIATAPNAIEHLAVVLPHDSLLVYERISLAIPKPIVEIKMAQ